METDPPAPVTTVTVDVEEPEQNATSSKSHAEVTIDCVMAHHVILTSFTAQKRIEGEVTSAHSVLTRCRLTLELFSRMFLDSVGAEAKSILHELGGFEV